MIKQVFRKNGILYVPKEDDIRFNYFIIVSYDKMMDMNQYKIEYYKKKKFIY
uniref:Uncharacterized protein n=1 Tax=viral metagenome TaxID=1070528 RepID=A0A6C0L2X7_9ZZZZ|tara:strand:- start:8295 stop:8450 length:156 start_codon:yes stop_codon:yes gene_type:complete